MKCRLSFYPRIRSAFSDQQELADVLNRSRRYVQYKMSGVSDFKHREKVMILDYLGEPLERMDFYFRRTL